MQEAVATLLLLDMIGTAIQHPNRLRLEYVRDFRKKNKTIQLPFSPVKELNNEKYINNQFL
jgi:hypothetical protein